MKNINIKFILLSILFILILSNRMELAFSYIPDLGGIETTMVYYIQRMLAGYEAYAFPDEPPFYFLQYTPLYFFLVDFVCRIFHIGADSVHSIYIIGRALNLCFHICIAYMMFKILKTFFKYSIINAFFVAIVSILFIYSLQYSVRSDALKSMFIVVSVFFYLKFLIEVQYKSLIICIFFISLAVFTKQDAIQFFVIYWIILLFVHPHKVLFFSLSSIVFLGLGCGILLIFYGNRLISNNFLGVQQGISLPYFFDFLKHSIPYYLFIFFSSVVHLKFKRGNDILRGSLFKILIISFIFSSLFGLKWGASPVYYMESVFISIILLFSYWDYILKSNLKATFSILFFVVFFLITKNYTSVFKMMNEKYEMNEYQTRVSIATEILKDLKTDEYILTFDKPLINQLHSKALFPMFEAEFPQYLPYGKNYHGHPSLLFNYEKFDDLLIEKKVKYYIRNMNDDIPDKFLSFDIKQFELKKTILRFEIYMVK